MTSATVAGDDTGSAPGVFTHRQILYILSGLMLGMFLAALDQTIVSTAIRTIADDLHGYQEQAWVTTAYLITSTIVTPLYGKLSDIYGRKPFFLFAITVFVIGSAMCSFATSMYELAAFRAFQGLGAGGLMSLALTIIGDIVPPRERAKYQGYFLAVFGTSSVLGPVLGGLLSGADSILWITGWRWVFLVNVPIGVLALGVVMRVLNLPHTRKHGVRIDWWGAITLAIGVVPLLIVAEQGRIWGWGDVKSIVCYVIGGVGIMLFITVEALMKNDAIIPLRIFKNPIFAQGVVISVVVGAAMFGAITLLPQYYQVVQGTSPTMAGIKMLPMVIGLMAGSIVSGQMISRTGKYRAFPVIGAVLLTGGIFALHYTHADTNQAVVMAVSFVLGFGLGNLMQPLTLAMQNILPPKDMGVSTAAATFFRQIGGTAGVAIFLSVLFSKLPDKLNGQLSTATSDPGYATAMRSAATGADGDAAKTFATGMAHDPGGTVSGVMSDTSTLEKLPSILAHPMKAAFADSMDVVFLWAAGLSLVALVLVLFWKSVPLRASSGAAEAHREQAAGGAAAGDAQARLVTERALAADAAVGAVPAVAGAVTAGAASDGAASDGAVRPAVAPERTEQVGLAKPAQAPSAASSPKELDELRASNRAMAAELAALRTDYRSMASRTRLAQEGLADPTRFTVEARLAAGGRAGRLFTPHGEVATPAFVPASTRGTVRAVLPESLRDLGAQALLASAYHLELMPGAGVIEEAGGLGRFMNWPGATFTESGAFALSGGDPDAQANGAARKTRVDEDGVSFRSHVDGSDHRFTPETSMQLQHRIGADVLFALDSPLQSGDRTAQREAVERNLLWARRGLAEHNWQTAQRRSARSLWAVVGGGEFEDLRRRAARDLRDLGDEDRVGGGLGFGGYVLTGVPSGVAGDIARWATAELDDVRPRHLLGACEPVDLFAAVEAGVDTVDSAAPSRAAKVGTVYTVDGTYSVTDPAYRSDFRSLDPETINYTSQYTRAYVHHLFEAQEGLAITLVTIHNEQFLVSLMARIRQAIVDGDYLRFKEDFLRRFSGGPTREPAAL